MSNNCWMQEYYKLNKLQDRRLNKLKRNPNLVNHNNKFLLNKLLLMLKNQRLSNNNKNLNNNNNNLRRVHLVKRNDNDYHQNTIIYNIIYFDNDHNWSFTQPHPYSFPITSLLFYPCPLRIVLSNRSFIYSLFLLHSDRSMHILVEFNLGCQEFAHCFKCIIYIFFSKYSFEFCSSIFEIGKCNLYSGPK